MIFLLCYPIGLALFGGSFLFGNCAGKRFLELSSLRTMVWKRVWFLDFDLKLSLLTPSRIEVPTSIEDIGVMPGEEIRSISLPFYEMSEQMVANSTFSLKDYEIVEAPRLLKVILLAKPID